MEINKWIIKFSTVCLLIFTGVANATLISYDIKIENDWFDNDGTPFSMPFSPVLTGSITVDNAQVNAAALVDFSLMTGTQLWTEADFVGTVASDIVFTSGELSLFRLDMFTSGGGSMYIYSSNTFRVTDGSNSNACNGCVSFTRSIANVPEPSVMALMMIGLFGVGFRCRRKL